MQSIIAFSFTPGDIGRASDFNKIRDDLLALQSNQTILIHALRDAFKFPVPAENVTISRYGGANLPNVDGVLLTATAPTLIARISMVNTSGALVQAHISLPDSGGSSSISNGIFHDFIPPGETFIIDGPFYINTNHTIRGAASASNAIAVNISLIQMVTHPSGLNYFFQQPGTVQQIEGTFFTATKKTIIDNFVIANSNNAVKAFYARHVLNGQATGPQHTIFQTTIQPFETVKVDGPIHMDIGDMFRVASATDSASLGCRITPIEIL